MASQPPDNQALQELKHQAVPGYLRAFLVALVVMGGYLALILITSPGAAKGKGAHKASTGKAQPESSR